MMQNHGCKLSPKDVRDYKIAPKGAVIASDFILDNLPKVKNQRHTSSCVAHAMSSVLEYHDKSVHTLSTNFIYGIQNKLFGRDSEGMYLSDACKIVTKYGDMLEEDCKGNNEVPRCYKIAESAFDDKVKLHRSKAHVILKYFNCTDENSIKYALKTYGPVLISINWNDNWEFNRDGYLTNPDVPRDEDGYHSVIIIGWCADGWICQNSWGTSFANKGRFVLPYSVEIDEAKGIQDNSSVSDSNDIIIPKRNKFLDIIYRILNYIINK